MFNTDKKLNIPKEFSLFGHKYDVVIKKDLFENEGCYGDADEDLKQIRLQDVGEVVKKIEDGDHVLEAKINITENSVIETYFHEMTHIILDSMGENELSENEKFVNMMGKAWLEIYLSTVYEKDSEKKEV